MSKKEELNITILKCIYNSIECLIKNEIDLDKEIPIVIINNLAELHSNLNDYLKGNK